MKYEVVEELKRGKVENLNSELSVQRVFVFLLDTEK